MRCLHALAGLMLCVLMAPGLTFGAVVFGHNDPRFRAALDLWLAEDDETALPEFAALAAGGNRAAQVLLAHIDATMPLQAPWLASLPRAERIALMRQPGGVSGRSWISAAATDTPLAAAWSALWSAADRDEVEIARAFAAMGEPRAVRMALTAMSLHKSRILRDVESPLITAALAATRGNQIRAAELLGLNRNTLRKKIRDHKLRVVRMPA
jgi:hypothetical protein